MSFGDSHLRNNGAGGGGGIIPAGVGYPLIPLTGQLTSYRTGDGAYYEALGDFSPTQVANPLYINELDYSAVTPWITLVNDNIHATKDRFTDRSGTQTYADGIIQDHLTGLEWLDTTAKVNWNTAIDDAVASTAGGDSDWFLPNIKQLETIANRYVLSMFNYAPFNISGKIIWSSSTGSTTTSAWRMTDVGVVNQQGKTTTNTQKIQARYFI